MRFFVQRKSPAVLVVPKTFVFGKKPKRPKTTEKDGFWDAFLSRNSFQNQGLKTQPFMERYKVDFEMPVKFVISEILYCLVLYRAIAFWRAV